MSIKKLREKTMKWQFLRLKTYTGRVKLSYSQIYRTVRNLLQEDAIVQIKGKLQTQEQDDHAKIIAEDITLLELQKDEDSGILYLRVPSMEEPVADQVMEVLEEYPGPSDVGIYYEKEGQRFIGKNFSVNGKSMQLRAQLAYLLGESNVCGEKGNKNGKNSCTM